MSREEPPQRMAEAGLFVGDDGGVRDRQAERVSEQGGNGEPVRYAADETGFGAGLQEVGPVAMREGEAAYRQSGHQDQQGGRYPFVAA